MYKFAFAFFILVFVMIKLTSGPSKVVVNQDGEIQGIFNELRASIQGNRFWENQAKEIKSEIEWELEEPQRQDEWNREMRELEREEKRELNEFYRENPELRPTRAQLMAEHFREKADRIEQNELDRELEQLRLEKIDKLRILLQTVNNKINQSTQNNPPVSSVR